MTVNVRPAIVSVPVRTAVVEFAAIENPTVPPPVPDWPEVTVIQVALLTAVQAHTAALAVTLTVAALFAAGTEIAVWLSVKLQPAAPACVCLGCGRLGAGERRAAHDV